jgi:hypothetical protein
MYAVAIAIQPGPEAATPGPAATPPVPRRIEPSAFADVLWANTLPEDRVEHIRTGAGPGGAGVDIVVFLHASDLTAGHVVGVLCRRTLAASPGLVGWLVASVSMNALT